VAEWSGLRSFASKKDSSRRHFDRWASRYERDLVSRWIETLQRTALETLALEPGDALLDVGCGTGAAVRAAAGTVQRAVGVDLSSGMVARGRELREADAEALPFEDDAFTAVLCTTSLHHYPHPERAIAEMARVVAPGGRVVVADATTDRRIVRLVDRLLRLLQPSHVGFHGAREIEQLLIGAGLDEPRTRSLLAGAYAIVAVRGPQRSQPSLAEDHRRGPVGR
jgi:SAM-dependent methyltransferase